MSIATAGDGPRDAQAAPPTVLGIFGSFLRLGVTAFGGPAMIPYIGEMAVARRQWLSRPSFKEGVVVAQTIPGATAMQVAAYVGLRARGLAGAAAAYVGFGLPAFVLMVVLSAVYGATHSMPVSKSIFLGLQVIVVAIVARAAFTFGRTTLKTGQDILIALAAAAYLTAKGNPILAIVAAAAVGLVLYRTKAGEAAEHRDLAELGRTTRPVLLIVLAALAGMVLLFLTDRRLFDLATLMLKVDFFAFGGGFASTPVMLHEVVDVKKWMTTRVLMDGIAMGQVTPGPLIITAAFVGYHLSGLLGAAIGTVAVFLPSFVILALVVPHFDRMKANRSFQRAMRGILASFVGLLVAVTLKFALVVPWSPLSVLLVCAAFTALMLKVDVPWVVIPGSIISVFIFR